MIATGNTGPGPGLGCQCGGTSGDGGTTLTKQSPLHTLVSTSGEGEGGLVTSYRCWLGRGGISADQAVSCKHEGKEERGQAGAGGSHPGVHAGAGGALPGLRPVGGGHLER